MGQEFIELYKELIDNCLASIAEGHLIAYRKDLFKRALLFYNTSLKQKDLEKSRPAMGKSYEEIFQLFEKKKKGDGL